MARIRVQLEVLAVAVVLVMLVGATVSRTLAMADHTQARSFATTGAHFVAGIEMVQAESRLAQRRKLNAVGYPTGAVRRVVERHGLRVDLAGSDA